MSNEDEEEENTIRGTDGGIVFRFDTPEQKEGFVSRMVHVGERAELIKGEGYKCGHCAAQPCYRLRKDDEPAGLCLQLTRRCRQECDFYRCDEFPASGGICKKDGRRVRYEEDCHIPEMRSKVRST